MAGWSYHKLPMVSTRCLQRWKQLLDGWKHSMTHASSYKTILGIEKQLLWWHCAPKELNQLWMWLKQPHRQLGQGTWHWLGASQPLSCTSLWDHWTVQWVVNECWGIQALGYKFSRSHFCKLTLQDLLVDWPCPKEAAVHCESRWGSCRSYKSMVEINSLDYTIYAIALLGHLDTLPTHVQPAVNQCPQLFFCFPATLPQPAALLGLLWPSAGLSTLPQLNTPTLPHTDSLAITCVNTLTHKHWYTLTHLQCTPMCWHSHIFPSENAEHAQNMHKNTQ